MADSSLEKLATEYITIFKNGGDLPGTWAYWDCRKRFTEMIDSVGYTRATAAIKQARDTYDLLVPADPD